MTDFFEKSQVKSSLLNKNQVEGLSPEQVQFAEEQYRMLYAQEMSRVSIDLNHKKKVLLNLHSIDEQEAENLKSQYERLKNKMKATEQKRNKNLQNKMKQYKQNDERWFHKIKEIQSKFKIQNKEAIEKAQKYREQSEYYWKAKEKKAIQNSRARGHSGHNNPTKSFSNSSIHYDHYSYENYERLKKKHITTELNHTQKDEFRQPKDLQSLDNQIRIHKQKSEHLQRQKEELIFQKAVQKMNKINKKREIINSKKQVKVAEPTVPRKIDNSYRDLHLRSDREKKHGTMGKYNQNSLSHSKESLEKAIKQHQLAKQRLEEEQFYHRGEIMDNVAQRTRKQRIMKMVRNKVQQAKLEAFKKQNSRPHF